MTKTCLRCSTHRPVSEYSLTRGRPNSWCKPCHRDYNRSYYRAEKKRFITSRRARRADRLAFVQRLKDEKRCRQCGQRFPHYVLDFDHTSKKTFGISSGIRRRLSRKRILEEVVRCELVCANCHRQRTQNRLTPDRIEGRRRMHRPDVVLLRALKEILPCTDCRKFFPYWVMDFDHVGKKTLAMRELWTRGRLTLKSFVAELSACEVRCANCHRRKTFERRIGRATRMR